MTGRVGGLVEVDYTRADVLLQVAGMRCASGGDRGIMGGANEYCRNVSCIIGSSEEAAYSRCNF